MKASIGIRVLLVSVLLVGAGSPVLQGVWVKRDWVVMGTRFSATILAPTQAAGFQVLDHVIDRVQDLDRRFTLYQPESELWRVNRAAGQGPQAVSKDLFRVLERALRFSRETGGAFDVTVGPLVRAWGFLEGPPRLPSQSQLDRARAMTGFGYLHLDRQRHTVSLDRPGMVLDLGAIAKGYALDRVVEILRRSGVRHGLLNLGGEVYALGSADGKTQPWPIGIRHPRLASRAWNVIEVQDLAVATSGNQERYFLYRGRRYGHILDPRTGRPVDSDVLSVTVVAPSATEADALATALFVLGPEEGRPVVLRGTCRFVLWLVKSEHGIESYAAPQWPPPRNCSLLGGGSL